MTASAVFLSIAAGAACDFSTEAPGERLEGTAAVEDDPQVDSEDFDAFTRDGRDFAFAMLRELREAEGHEENVFFSPYSILSALAMTYAGADGDTRAQMAEALRFRLDDDALHPAFNRLARELEAREEADLGEDEELVLRAVNQTWGQKDYPFREDYLDVLSRHYGAGLQVADFRAEADSIRREINAWVEDQTEGLIEDLIPEGEVDELTRLVLVNAIYFYATWEDTFDPGRTEDRPFARTDGSEAEVPLMRHDDPVSAGYYGGEDTTAVSLPYVGGDLAMVALKPADAEAEFRGWEEALDRERFDAVLDDFETLQGFVEFPKFEDEGEFDLIPPFQELGMEDAFQSADADFGQMIDLEEAGERIFISGIFHKTFIDVDEEGTEAAAATGVVAGTDSAPQPDFEVSFDRPFVYALYDRQTRALLFMGRMLDPS